MPTAILAEDEPVLRAELRETLSALWPELDILDETDNGVSTLNSIKALTPDVVFLDINMPRLTGLEVAKAIQGKTSIVFLTAYNQHALEAFDLGALDYLVKPLNRGRLVQTIERLKNQMGKIQPAIPNAVWDSMAPVKLEQKYLRWIQASVGNLLRLITTDEIYFFQADAKYTRVVTANT